MMILILGIATIVCIGMLIGTEFAVSVFINPVLRKLDDRAQAEAIRLFAGRLGRAMPFWYVLSLVLLIAESILRRHEQGIFMLASACAIWTAVILLTVMFLVPINNRMMKLDPDSFAGKPQREHKKWDTLHRFRVLSLAVAMLCFLLAGRL